MMLTEENGWWKDTRESSDGLVKAEPDGMRLEVMVVGGDVPCPARMFVTGGNGCNMVGACLLHADGSIVTLYGGKNEVAERFAAWVDGILVLSALRGL